MKKEESLIEFMIDQMGPEHVLEIISESPFVMRFEVALMSKGIALLLNCDSGPSLFVIPLESVKKLVEGLGQTVSIIDQLNSGESSMTYAKKLVDDLNENINNDK